MQTACPTALFGFGCLLAVELSSPQIAGAAQQSPTGINHAFLATGQETYIISHRDTVIWSYERPTRDGWVLPSGNILLALAKGPNYGGGVIEVTRAGQRVFEYKGTQAEVNTVQPLPNGRVLITEAGPEPCLKEIDRAGRAHVQFRLQCQTNDFHLQSRMARKLANGNYLVPQMLDKVVREYSAEGKVIWEVKTPGMPFTAIRLENSHTLIACTIANRIIEVDAKGKTVWQLTSEELPGKPFNDVCGVQRLPNGNTVLTSYHGKQGAPQLIEVTREKKIVWTYTDARRPGIHHFQILNDRGQPLAGAALR